LDPKAITIVQQLTANIFEHLINIRVLFFNHTSIQIEYHWGMKKSLFTACLILSLQSFAQVLFPIEIKGKWGYMNAEGQMVLPATFDYADDFAGDYAVVAKGNQPCIINKKGKAVIDTGMYQFISPVSEGMAAVSDYRKHKFYINMQGKKVITLSDSIYEVRKFKNGLAVVSKQIDIHETKFGRDISTLGYRFAYMDTTGKMVTDFIFDDADDLRNGLAKIRQGILFGLIDSTGTIILKPTYNNIGDFNEGLAAVDVNGKYGYINPKGGLVIPATFDYAYDFSEGLAGVWMNQKYGYINPSGTIVIPATFDQIKPFSEGKAAILKEGKWGFIDKTGTLVLRNVFDNASVFKEGKCAVLIKRYWGFIDTRGALIIPADFDAVGSFEDGVADVVYHDINVYINSRGMMIPNLKK
jgi:hypothetical protein